MKKKINEKQQEEENAMKMMMLKMKKINEVGKKVSDHFLSTLHLPPTKFALEILLKVPNFWVFVQQKTRNRLKPKE